MFEVAGAVLKGAVLGFHYESEVEVWIEGEQEKMGFMKRRWDYEREDGIMKEKTGFMKEKMGFMKRRWDL